MELGVFLTRNCLVIGVQVLLEIEIPRDDFFGNFFPGFPDGCIPLPQKFQCAILFPSVFAQPFNEAADPSTLFAARSAGVAAYL